MIKKLIALFSTIIVIFSVIFPCISNADEGAFGAYGEHQTIQQMQDESGLSQESIQSTTEKGTANVGNGQASIDIADDSVNSLLKNSIKFFNIFPTSLRWILRLMTADDNPADPTINDKYGKDFSIQKTVFGKIRMFDVNFLHRDSNEDSLQRVIKDKIAQFFYLVRNLAIALMLIVLIYTGIRMAMSTVVSSKVRYKTMLKDWAVSFVILMTLQFFMVLVLEIGSVASNLCESVMNDMIEDEDECKIEERLFEQATMSTSKKWSIIVPTILYWLLTYYQIKFFLMYCRRLLTMGFLVVIAPLITVSYSIDKARRWKGTSIENMACRIYNGCFNTADACIYIYDIYDNGVKDYESSTNFIIIIY